MRRVYSGVSSDAMAFLKIDDQRNYWNHEILKIRILKAKMFCHVEIKYFKRHKSRIGMKVIITCGGIFRVDNHNLVIFLNSEDSFLVKMIHHQNKGKSV
jgi:hypothetical protein